MKRRPVINILCIRIPVRIPFGHFLSLMFAALILSAGLASCGLFETRNPEEPSGSTTGFQQPVSELVVLSNFQGAIQENNTENLIRCLADTTAGARRAFRFEPSIDVLTSFAEQFRSWNRDNERQAFYSMASKIPATSKSSLQLRQGRFELRVPDSAVYVADYVLSVPHSSASIPTMVAGTMRLTIVHDDVNQWYIDRWSDATCPLNDSISKTWSTLKAAFSN